MTAITCRRCGESIPRAATGRPPRYCSRNCRQRDYETRRALKELGVQGAGPSIDSDETRAAARDETPSPPRDETPQPSPTLPAVRSGAMPTPDMALPRRQRGSLFPSRRGKT